MCGCVNHTRFYGGDRIRRFKLGSLVLPRYVRLRCDEGRCVVRIDVLHSLHRLSIAQRLPDREDRLLCLSLLFAGDRDRHLGTVNGLVQLLIESINECIGNEWGFRCNVIYTLIPFILLCFVRLQGKKMERKRKEREVELREEKIVDVNQQQYQR